MGGMEYGDQRSCAWTGESDVETFFVTDGGRDPVT